MVEKTINILGKDVRICYCAGTENAFEQITGKSISVFVPTFGKDENGQTIITQKAEALTGDYIFLGIGGIITAYSRTNKEKPVTDAQILYDAQPQDISTLVTTIAELRNKWYNVPEVIEREEQPAEEEDKPKN